MPEQWVDVLTAIVEHDDHLLDFDEQDYLTDGGTPLDFTMAKGSNRDSLEHAEKVFSNAMQKSQLIALLVGRHLEFLYGGLAKEYAPMKKFLEGISELRGGQRKLYRLDKTDEDGLYNIMLFCDRCSLVLCQNEVPETGRKLEINRTIGDKVYYIHKGDENGLTIEPWPFKKERFTLELEYRVLEDVKFKNNDELEQAISKAKIELLSFTLKK